MHESLRDLRENILRASCASGEGHVASAFSILDLLWVLYSSILNQNPLNPTDVNRDRFVLSKGHASLGLYAVLSSRGFFPPSELNSFAAAGSRLGGHPDARKVPGVEASTGSLGHGMPMAVGISLGLKIRNSTQRVFCLVGDGECNEGTIWESALLAAHHRLDNLTCIIDYNHPGDRALTLGDLTAKLESFGWDTCEVNGHDVQQIESALQPSSKLAPKAVIAHTVKGKGCEVMENNPAWHHKAPNPDELETLIASLK